MSLPNPLYWPFQLFLKLTFRGTHFLKHNPAHTPKKKTTFRGRILKNGWRTSAVMANLTRQAMTHDINNNNTPAKRRTPCSFTHLLTVYKSTFIKPTVSRWFNLHHQLFAIGKLIPRSVTFASESINVYEANVEPSSIQQLKPRPLSRQKKRRKKKSLFTLLVADTPSLAPPFSLLFSPYLFPPLPTPLKRSV